MFASKFRVLSLRPAEEIHQIGPLIPIMHRFAVARIALPESSVLSSETAHQMSFLCKDAAEWGEGNWYPMFADPSALPALEECFGKLNPGVWYGFDIGIPWSSPLA